MQISIVYSLPTARSKQNKYVVTDEDTEASAIKVRDALLQKGAQVALIPLTPETLAQIARIRADCVFNLIEWDDEDLPASIRAFDYLEALPVPVTGATRKNYLETTDKALMKKAFDRLSLPTARWQIFETGREPIRTDFIYPVLVKLTQTHCSVGLSKDAIAHTPEELVNIVARRLSEFGQPLLAEEFIDGREFQITVLDRPGGLTVLPAAEVIFRVKDAETFLTYESRWVESDPLYKTTTMGLAKLTKEEKGMFETVALKTFRELGFRDYSRLDVRMRQEGAAQKLYILEANSNPGLDDNDEYGIPISYKAVGMTFADFVWEVVASALKRGS